jgi:SAM-dependent methyltransferase
MPKCVRSIFASLVLVLGAEGLGDALAQAPAGPAAEHNHAGHEHAAPRPERSYQHSFEHADRWSKTFDDPARDAWQKPDELLDALNLAPNARVADVGAGTGYFSVRLARRLPEGKVLAVDIEPDMLRYLGERAQREHLSVIVPVLANAETPNLSEPVDLVLLVDTYHHIDNRVAYFARLRSSLRPNGRLAIVDFKADSPEGPPPQHRISPDKVTAELTAAGYSLVATHNFLPRQYFMVFQDGS